MSRSSPNRARGRAPGRGNSKGTEAWKNVTCSASGTSSQMPAVSAETEMGRQARARPKGSDAEEAGLPWEGGTEGTDGLQAKEGHMKNLEGPVSAGRARLEGRAGTPGRSQPWSRQETPAAQAEATGGDGKGRACVGWYQEKPGHVGGE